MLIHGGLKLQQQIDIEPAALPIQGQPHPPQDVVLALAQVVADADLAHALQRLEVQRPRPVPVHEAANQVGDHLAVGEEQFVGGIVLGHG